MISKSLALLISFFRVPVVFCFQEGMKRKVKIDRDGFVYVVLYNTSVFIKIFSHCTAHPSLSNML